PGDLCWAEPEGSYLAAPAPPRLRIGFQATAGSGVDPEIQALVRRAASELEGLGHHVEEGGPETGAFLDAMRLLVISGTATYAVADTAALDPVNARMIAAAGRPPPAAHVPASHS